MLPDQELLRRLVELRPALERAGGVIARAEQGRRPSLRLRCRTTVGGVRRQIAIPLTPEQAEMVTRQIATWRASAQEQEARAARADHDREARRQEWRKIRRQFLARVGGSSWRRRQAAKALREAEGAGEWAVLDIVLGRPFEMQTRKPGRPRKRRLVLPCWG